jgi:multiple sugar transport system permease protein
MVLIFMGLYGEFLWPLVATSSNEMQVLSVWLAGRTQGYGVNPGLMAASATLVVLPMVVVYIAGQRYIVQGIGLQGFR